MENLLKNIIPAYDASPTRDTMLRIAREMYQAGYRQGEADATARVVERYEMLESSDITDKSFMEFWHLYDKKVGRTTCQSLWRRLTKRERREILEYVPIYVQAQPDKRYRKNPATFLRQKSWHDEIIPSRYVAVQQQNIQNSNQAVALAETLARYDLEKEPPLDPLSH